MKNIVKGLKFRHEGTFYTVLYYDGQYQGERSYRCSPVGGGGLVLFKKSSIELSLFLAK
jgi:hypothetical protein